MQCYGQFAHPDLEIDKDLRDFMEKSVQQYTGDEFAAQGKKFIITLEEDPEKIIELLASSEKIAPSFTFETILNKMKNMKCAEKLNVLFEEHLDKLVESCMIRLGELGRFKKIMPNYAKAISDSYDRQFLTYGFKKKNNKIFQYANSRYILGRK